MFVWEATDVAIMLSQFEGGGRGRGGGGVKATGEEGDGKAIRCGRGVWTSAHRKAETLAKRECVRLSEFELRGESYFSSPMRMSSSCRSKRSSSFSLIYSTCLTVSGRCGEHGNAMAAPPRKTRSSCI